MKVNILCIIRAHWMTLRDAESMRLSYCDVFVFYIIPLVISFCSYLLGVSFRTEVYNLSITFFGIFIALLLNIQVAVFGVFLRKWDLPTEERQARVQKKKIDERRNLLSEMNTNISYLIVVSSFSLASFVVFFIAEMQFGFAPAVAIGLYIHFILTFFMVLKRSYSLFQSEYDDVNQ